ncbi:MAG: putative rane protein [Herbinix sp.]|jgi:predicted permease|nr:putative rane protein [Herbinix sp.]
MDLAITAFNQIVIMFLLIVAGALCYKIKLIDKETNKKLSDLVLMLINPLVIFASYQREFEASLLKGLLISLLLATVTHIVAIILSYFFLHKKKHQADIAIERFGMIYSNCGFIGIPLVNGIFHSEGVFYITAYMTIFNLVLWTHGVIIMTGKKNLKTMGKALLSPSVIATLSGFLFFIAKIGLPEIPLQAINYIGNMNTPMAMMVAGVTIAQLNLLKLFTKLRTYYITVLKLLFVPILMLFIYHFFEIPRVVLLTSILGASCPTAATITLFSLRYEKNSFYASEIFAITTILSIITIPVVMTIAGYFV